MHEVDKSAQGVWETSFESGSRPEQGRQYDCTSREHSELVREHHLPNVSYGMYKLRDDLLVLIT